MTRLDEVEPSRGRARASPAGRRSGRPSRSGCFDLIAAHRSTIVFTNSRRGAERLCARLNELAAGSGVRARRRRSPGAAAGRDHGPGRRRAGRAAGDRPGPPRQRLPRGAQAHRGGAEVRPAARRGRHLQPGAGHRHGRGRPGRADRGAAQSVAAGLQRVGRAGHQVGAVSRGVVFPKHRGDLLSCAVVAERMARGRDRGAALPAQPARRAGPADRRDGGAGRRGTVGDLAALVRRAAPFAELPDSALHAVLDMLSGRYPSTAFAELRPRLVWDRADRPAHRPPGRPAARGHQRRHHPRPRPVRRLPGRRRAGRAGRRARRGDGLRVAGRRRLPARLDAPGASRTSRPTGCWSPPRPAQAGPDAVLEGRPARAGRSSWAGRSARGCATLVRHGRRARRSRRCADGGLDEWAADNLVAYLREQREATRHLPDDRTVVVERFRDELGDWRLAVHCVLGARVNGAVGAGDRAPAGRAVRRRRAGACRPTTASSCACPTPPTSRPAPTWSRSTPRRSRRSSRSRSARRRCSPSRFRECAARALLLPRRDPRRRQPLWQQRQRAAQLLDVAREYADFPVTLEAARECLQDVFDVPGLVGADARDRRPQGAAGRGGDAAAVAVRPVAAVRLRRRVPLRGRRAAGRAPGGRAGARLHAARRAARPGRPARAARPGGGDRDRAAAAVADRRAPALRDAEDVAELLRLLGDLSPSRGWRARRRAGVGSATLAAARRAVAVRIAGEERWIGVEDAGRVPRRARASRCRSGVARGLPRAGRRPARRPGRPVRPHARPVRRGRLRGPVRPRRVRGRAGAQAARRHRPGGRRRVHARRRRHRVVRRRGAAAAAPPVAGRAAPRDRAGAARGARRVPAALAAGRRVGARGRGGRRGDRAAAGRRGAGVGAGAAGAAGPGGRLLARLPRRAVRRRRGGLGRRRLDRRRRRLGDPGLRRLRPAAAAAAGRRRWRSRPLHEAVLDALGDGQALFFRSLSDRCRRDRRRRRWSPRCGTWCGPAGSPTTPSRRCARCSAAAGRTGRGRGAPRTRYRRPGRPGRIALPPRTGPPSGRRPLVTGCPTATSTRPGAPPRWPTLLLERHGVVTRGAVDGRGRAGRVRRRSTRCSPRWRSAARPGAATSSKGWARPSSPCPARSTGCARWPSDCRRARPARQALVLAATDPANPYGAALPWPERVVDTGDGEAAGSRPPGRPQGRRAGRPGRRRADALRRARRPHAAVLHRRSATRWPRRPRRWPTPCTPARWAPMSVERADGEAVHSSPLRDALTAAGFRATPRGLRLRG